MGIFDKAKDLARGNPDKADRLVDKIGDMIDQRTGGQHAEHIDKAQDFARGQYGGAQQPLAPEGQEPLAPEGQEPLAPEGQQPPAPDAQQPTIPEGEQLLAPEGQQQPPEGQFPEGQFGEEHPRP